MFEGSVILFYSLVICAKLSVYTREEGAQEQRENCEIRSKHITT